MSCEFLSLMKQVISYTTWYQWPQIKNTSIFFSWFNLVLPGINNSISHMINFVTSSENIYRSHSRIKNGHMTSEVQQHSVTAKKKVTVMPWEYVYPKPAINTDSKLTINNISIFVKDCTPNSHFCNWYYNSFHFLMINQDWSKIWLQKKEKKNVYIYIFLIIDWHKKYT